MPSDRSSLRDRLGRYNEINITVKGRKSGREISLPVWFVLEGEKLYLLPVKGSETQWYQNVVKNSSLRVQVRGAEAQLKPVLIEDAKEVSAVTEKFRTKYGASDVKKYYSKFDVAITAHIQ